MHHTDAQMKEQNAQLVEIMTPLVKGWCTEVAMESTSLGIQVHGGMGFIEETGAAQHMRDARILPIYEGTMVFRRWTLLNKCLRDGGAGLKNLIANMEKTESSSILKSKQTDYLLEGLKTAIGQCEKHRVYPHQTRASTGCCTTI